MLPVGFVKDSLHDGLSGRGYFYKFPGNSQERGHIVFPPAHNPSSASHGFDVCGLFPPEVWWKGQVQGGDPQGPAQSSGYGSSPRSPVRLKFIILIDGEENPPELAATAPGMLYRVWCLRPLGSQTWFTTRPGPDWCKVRIRRVGRLPEPAWPSARGGGGGHNDKWRVRIEFGFGHLPAQFDSVHISHFQCGKHHVEFWFFNRSKPSSLVVAIVIVTSDNSVET